MQATTERSGAPRQAGPTRGANETEQDGVLAREVRLNALLRQEHRLRDEIQRGRECLEQAKQRLAECQATLEDWPLYEKRCGANCLPGLTEAVRLNKRVERFLTGWLKRREDQMALMAQEIQRYPGQHSLARFSAELKRQADGPQAAPPFISEAPFSSAATRCAA